MTADTGGCMAVDMAGCMASVDMAGFMAVDIHIIWRITYGMEINSGRKNDR